MRLQTVFLCLLIICLSPRCYCKKSYQPVSNNEALKYLNNYGYVGTTNVLTSVPQGKLSQDIEDTYASLKSAIRKFQEFAGLRQTGELDEATKKKMAEPRCGVTDVLAMRRGGAAFKWDKTDLTYSIESYSPDLPRESIRKAISQAFNVWSAVTPLNFEEVTKGGDIKIKFAGSSHGDPWPFDGIGGVLAHATMPTNGMLHFDEDENWVFMDTEKLSRGDYTDLLAVAIHESGHTLGLDHSRDEDSIMAPFLQETVDRYGKYHMPTLKTDDITKIQDIYGPRRGAPPKAPIGESEEKDGGGSRVTLGPSVSGETHETEDSSPGLWDRIKGFFGGGSGSSSGKTDSTPPPPPPSRPTRPSSSNVPVSSDNGNNGGPLSCPDEVDAVITVKGTIYLLSAMKVYEIHGNKVTNVESMIHMFPNGPPYAQGALTNPDGDITLIFQDRKVYAYTFDSSKKTFKLDKEYPKRLPSSLTFNPMGAFRWADGREILFMADDFAVYDDYWNQVTMQGKVSTYFKNFPTTDAIRGAAPDGDNMLLFTNNNVYNYDVRRSNIDGVGMPIRKFLGC